MIGSGGGVAPVPGVNRRVSGTLMTTKLRLPDMVRWAQLPESKSSRSSGFFWVNMRLSRFIATFLLTRDMTHDDLELPGVLRT